MTQPTIASSAWSPLRVRPGWPADAAGIQLGDGHALLLSYLRATLTEPQPTVGQLLRVVDSLQSDPQVGALYSDTALARLTIEDILEAPEAEGSRALELGELIAAWMLPPTGERPRDRKEPLEAYLRAGLDYALAIEEMQASITPDDGVWLCRVGHVTERHSHVGTAIRACYVRWVTPIRERVERIDAQLASGRGNVDHLEASRMELTERAHAWRLTRYAL